MPSRITVLACFALASACASSVSVTRAPATDAAAPPADVVNLDDPTLRIQCPPGQPDPCGPGRHCIAVGPGFLGVCTRDGGHGALCRTTPIACDEGIPCLDQWCDQHGSFSVRTTCGGRLCAVTEGCVEVGGALRCVANGAAGGYCRQDGVDDGCDVGLRCDDAGNNRSRCGRPIAPGGLCSLVGNGVDFCDTGTTCVLTDGIAPRCQANGGPGTPCVTNDACRPGLECQIVIGAARPTCEIPVQVGDRCDTSTPGSVLCASGTSCAMLGDGTRHCATNGSYGALCRDTQPPCINDLLCHPDFQVCAAPIPVGAACDPTRPYLTCVEGSSCLANDADGALVCRPDGALNTRCRRSKEPCDVGLVCDFAHGQLCQRP